MSNLKIFTDNVEEKALEQINTLVSHPAFADCKIRIMPDVHAGAGCVIGFTADLGDKVIPNIVGVDIGCGMFVIPLGHRDIDLVLFDKIVRARVPAGRNVHGESRLEDSVATSIINKLRCKEFLRNMTWLERSLGTLGGGNHFIEIDEDDEGNKYLIIHTGSRNLGKQVADYYQKLAIERIRSKHIDIPKELCYLEGEDRDNYLHDMKLCQLFAKINREIIADEILDGMYYKQFKCFHTIHNYIDNYNMVRKGAISAKDGERLLIPINMRDGCILGVGKGDDDWNQSAPHGAGRIMSRRKAKEMISMDEYKKSMDGIYTTSVDESTIDERPMAYKPIDEILKNIKNTVHVEKIIKPIYNFKASE